MRILVQLGWAVAVLAIAIQFVPYGRDHTNPPASAGVEWADDSTATLFAAACADCHSHETTWPWYASIAPVSWMVQRDVDEGRAAFNTSTWPDVDEGDDAGDSVRDAEMPPFPYGLTHPAARLTDAQRVRLAAGLDATFGGGDDD